MQIWGQVTRGNRRVIAPLINVATKIEYKATARTRRYASEALSDAAYSLVTAIVDDGMIRACRPACITAILSQLTFKEGHTDV